MFRILLFAASAPCFAQDGLRMNQIQIVGTHNSYHAGLAPGEMELLRKQNPRAAQSLAYKHPSLEQQLDAGVRQLEIDVYGDAKGGLFGDPLYLRLTAKEGTATPMPAGWKETMQKPGFKVLHVADLDYRSHCFTFVACLETVRGWSQKHPGHLPIFILIENKDGRPNPAFLEPETITKATMDALDAEVRTVFKPAELITPDQVRGSHATLEDAVLKTGWPRLSDARGKIVFLLDQERVTPLYTDGHPSLKGRMIFTNGQPGTPDAAFVKLNNATSPQITELVRKGYLVRTMTDGGGNTTRRDAAIASGAHMLSTDYPFDWKQEATGFHVTLGDEKARCNPVNAPKPCALPKPF